MVLVQSSSTIAKLSIDMQQDDLVPSKQAGEEVPLERDINIAVNGSFWMEVANEEHPFTAHTWSFLSV